MTAISDVNKKQKATYNTQNNTFDMFDAHDKVKVICASQDWNFFKGTEVGTIIENTKQYLGIIIKFDDIKENGSWAGDTFGFNPEDLILLEKATLKDGKLPLRYTILSKRASDNLKDVIGTITFFEKDIELLTTLFLNNAITLQPTFKSENAKIQMIDFNIVQIAAEPKRGASDGSK